MRLLLPRRPAPTSNFELLGRGLDGVGSDGKESASAGDAACREVGLTPDRFGRRLGLLAVGAVPGRTPANLCTSVVRSQRTGGAHDVCCDATGRVHTREGRCALRKGLVLLSFNLHRALLLLPCGTRRHAVATGHNY